MKRVVRFIHLKWLLVANSRVRGQAAAACGKRQRRTRAKKRKIEIEMFVLRKHGKTLSVKGCW